jgi:hypothetical protein
VAFKTFTAGAVLTASDVNTYLAKQAVVVCTSTTRPASPPEGMVIYETDTDKMLTYVSATTGWVPPWSNPWGVVTATSGGTSGYGYVRLTSSAQSGIGTTMTDITNATVTFTATANRLYRVSAQADMNHATTSENAQVQVLLDGTAIATNAIAITTAGAYNDRFAVITTTFTTTSGSHTVKLQAATKSGTMTIQNAAATPTILLVEDAGPAGAPA